RWRRPEHVAPMRKCRQKDLTGCNQSVVGTAPNSSLNISPEDSCSLDDVKGMLKKRFQSIDFRQAKEDVLPFIRDPGVLDLWSENFFNAVTERLESLEGD
ncbi:hypothetical protein ACTQ28_11610, partial [Bacillota bacterium LCP21S3_A4]